MFASLQREPHSRLAQEKPIAARLFRPTRRGYPIAVDSILSWPLFANHHQLLAIGYPARMPFRVPEFRKCFDQFGAAELRFVRPAMGASDGC